MAKYLTREGLEKFKKELGYLENTKRREIAERLRYTSSFGDLKENAAYHEAKEAQGFVEGRILELKMIVANARVIEKKGDGVVGIGSLVILDSLGKKEEFQIVDPQEVDIFQGKISNESPLGKMLLGKIKGDKIILENPDGKTEYKVTDIQ